MPKEVTERIDHFFITSPPLSILTLATYLDAKGVDVRIIDMELDYGLPLNENGEKKLINHFIDDIFVEKIDWIGFSTTTHDHCQASVNLALAVKEINPEIPIIFGGYQATITTEDLLKKYNCIDAVVVSEGERTSFIIHQRIVNGQSIFTSKIENLAFRNNDGIMFSARGPLIDLAKIPPLKFEFLENMDKYPIMSLLSSRGCPFNCAYCTEQIMRNKYRVEPMKKIARQVKIMQELNSVRNMGINDPLFGINSKRTKQICQILKDANYSFAYETRADVFKPSMLPEIQKTGGEVMLLGLESTSKDTLLRMNKFVDESCYHQYIQNATKLIDMCFQHDVTPMLSLMLGYPGDTLIDLQSTVDFVNKSIALYSRYYPDEDAGPGLMICPHIVFINPQSRLSYQLDDYKKKGLSYEEGDLFRPTMVKNPSSKLKHTTVLNYKKKLLMLSKITPKTMDRLMRLVWCDFKKLIEHDPTIVTNDFLSTLSAYQILVKSNRKLH